jgi:predicted ATP-dependent endonuclease of OLD family
MVEGDPDEIACRSALEALGADLDRRSISVLSVGGQTEMPTFAELLAGLRIPVIALVDEDPNNRNSADNRARIAAHLPGTNILLQMPNLQTLWNLQRKPDRVAAMTSFPAACANPQSIPQVYRDLQVLLDALAP